MSSTICCSLFVPSLLQTTNAARRSVNVGPSPRGSERSLSTNGLWHTTSSASDFYRFRIQAMTIYRARYRDPKKHHW
jgi:hypothetical protein